MGLSNESSSVYWPPGHNTVNGKTPLTKVCHFFRLLVALIGVMGGASPNELFPTAFAQQTSPIIRVGLAFEVEGCRLSSGDGLEIADALGKPISHPGDDITITPGLDGFVTGGRTLPGNAIIVHSQINGGAVTLNRHSYRGQMVILRGGSGRLNVVNYVDIEAYVAGVLAGEVPSTWPEESLKAQAVAARSYVLYQVEHRGGHDWDVVATDKDQVYDGTAGEVPSIMRAVRTTRGEVLTYQEKIVKAYFHSACGGHTEDAKNVFGETAPYLVGVPDPYCHSQAWKRDFSSEYLRRVLSTGGRKKLGTILAVKAASRAATGRVQQIVISYDGGQETIASVELRRLLGYREMRSTMFDMHVKKTAASLVAVRLPEKEKKNADPVGALTNVSTDCIEPVTRIIGPQEPFHVVASDHNVQTNRAGYAFAATALGILRTFAMRPGLTILGLVRHVTTAGGAAERKTRVKPPAPRQRKLVPAVITFSGRGWGHGVGMCQWGARGMAAHGVGYRDILKHFYPVTQLMVVQE